MHGQQNTTTPSDFVLCHWVTLPIFRQNISYKPNSYKIHENHFINIKLKNLQILKQVILK